ncbi:hypothetical protein ISN45_Aa05g029760 [Arabidopsis thaliana x Arabidopsis arenosa]|uniref:Uncharacterized protein n=1 Tax=Arabidopsis thaliana x Arabidopsis arenosa TaxID=1240361 RepID=A0A8T1ZQ52_9BRAS|nr:hypothetical protein ISN45_Aa05g029760 [Arabidopsis thaliana x Arabidopsis arenosa]
MHGVVVEYSRSSRLSFRHSQIEISPRIFRYLMVSILNLFVRKSNKVWVFLVTCHSRLIMEIKPSLIYVVLNKYRYAGITLHSHVCKCTRLNHMILDILLWKLDNDPDYFHPLNLVYCMITLHQGECHHLLMRLIEDIVWWARIKRDYIETFNILFAQHDEHDDSDKALAIANDVWVWETLFDGGEPLGPYVTDSEEESSHGAKRFKTDADSDDKCI